MHKLFGVIILIFLAGCAAPKYKGSAIGEIKTKNVVIIHDSDTKSGFEQEMADWLTKRGYKCAVVPEGTKYDSEKLNLEYNGIWKWDLAIFLSRAVVSAFYEGQKIGQVEYYAENNLNTAKFANGAERVSYMMDILFGEKTAIEVNKIIVSGSDKPRKPRRQQ